MTGGAGVTTGGGGDAWGGVGVGVGTGGSGGPVGVDVAVGGVGSGPLTAVTAESAFRRPPVTDSPANAGFTSTEVRSACRSSHAVASGLAASANAAAPATCGDAIDVPLR